MKRENPMPDDQQVRNDTVLREVMEVESCWRTWYNRKLTTAERMAYFLGRINGQRMLTRLHADRLKGRSDAH